MVGSEESLMELLEALLKVDPAERSRLDSMHRSISLEIWPLMSCQMHRCQD